MASMELCRQMLVHGLLFYRNLVKKQTVFAPRGIGDFTYCFIAKFPPEGSSITPSHNLQCFDFIISAPLGFTIIHKRFNMSTLKIMTEISKRELHLSTFNPFDKDRLTFVSNSGKYTLRKIHHKEAIVVIEYLQRYSKCVSGIAHSFLPRFLGIFSFRLSSKSTKTEHFLLISVGIPRDYKIHKQFELFYNEKLVKQDKAEQSSSSGVNDFKYNHPDGFLMNAKQRKTVLDILEHDLEILRVLRVLNYSLRIYVHNFNLSKREVDDEIKNIRRRSTFFPPRQTMFNNNLNQMNNLADERLNYHKSNQFLDVDNKRTSMYRLDNKNSIKAGERFHRIKSISTESLSIGNIISTKDKNRRKSFKEISKNAIKPKIAHLFNSAKLQADFYKAKRNGAMFVYDIKGEHLAIFLSFGHIYDQTERLYNYKAILKSTFPGPCTDQIITTASYADKFEQFLVSHVFRPVKLEMVFELWPDEIERISDIEKEKKVVNPIDKWADIKARLLSESTSEEASLLSEHQMLSEVPTTSSTLD